MVSGFLYFSPALDGANSGSVLPRAIKAAAHAPALPLADRHREQGLERGEGRKSAEGFSGPARSFPKALGTAADSYSYLHSSSSLREVVRMLSAVRMCGALRGGRGTRFQLLHMFCGIRALCSSDIINLIKPF